MIVGIEVFCWGSNSISQYLSQWGLFYGENKDAYTVWCAELVLSYLLVIATTVNAPVLCVFRCVTLRPWVDVVLFSETYRKAFLGQLRSLRTRHTITDGVIKF